MSEEFLRSIEDSIGEILAHQFVQFTKRAEMRLSDLEAKHSALSDALTTEIAQLKCKALAHIESLVPLHGKDGEPGKDGAPGRDGLDGKDGSPGLPGESGKDGHDGIDGKEGAAGRDGRDGLSGIQGPGGLDGKDGRDGIDGKDGLGFDDLTCEYDGARVVTLRFIQGEREKGFTFKLPIIIDCGVFKEAETYELADGVTYGGSFWIAQKDAPDGKPGLSPDWRLAVKHGRDGKQGERGLPGKDGEDGRAGRDLTQLGADGAKW